MVISSASDGRSKSINMSFQIFELLTSDLKIFVVFIVIPFLTCDKKYSILVDHFMNDLALSLMKATNPIAGKCSKRGVVVRHPG